MASKRLSQSSKSSISPIISKSKAGKHTKRRNPFPKASTMSLQLVCENLQGVGKKKKKLSKKNKKT